MKPNAQLVKTFLMQLQDATVPLDVHCIAPKDALGIGAPCPRMVPKL